MTKKSKRTPYRGGFQGKDNFLKMNFLYQAAQYCLSSAGTKGDLSSHYSRVMCCVSKKTVLKIEPDIKRGICKGCCLILQPGMTARVRIKRGTVIWTCLRCGTLKRYPTKRGYELWIDKEDACLEVLEVPTVHDDLAMPCETGKESLPSSTANK